MLGFQEIRRVELLIDVENPPLFARLFAIQGFRIWGLRCPIDAFHEQEILVVYCGVVIIRVDAARYCTAYQEADD